MEENRLGLVSCPFSEPSVNWVQASNKLNEFIPRWVGLHIIRINAVFWRFKEKL
jgi:hypothetical protein